jgi:hypothetical protein
VGTEEEKGDRELKVFLDFVRVSGLPIDQGTVQKRTPPEPDILCRHSADGYLAFELVELCDPALARVFADPERFGDTYIRTADPSPVIIRNKLRKAYGTQHPIELLCYTDGRVITPSNVIIPTIGPYLRSFKHMFRRAWLFSGKSVVEVWQLHHLDS